LSDLSTISAKKIRRALAKEFPHDEIALNKVRSRGSLANNTSHFSTNGYWIVSVLLGKKEKGPQMKKNKNR
jgi:hypothetical protein